MSWGLFSDRIFCISSNATPEKLGPGKYEVATNIGNEKTMKRPFNLGQGPPKNPAAKIPGPGQYEAKPLEDGTAFQSVFESKTQRKAYTEKNDNHVPSPTAYSKLESWMPEPPAIPKKELPRYKAPSGFVGQDVIGYVEDDSHELIPIKKPEIDKTFIGPGYYEPVLPPSRENPPVSLEMSAKRDLYGIPPDVPGPGSYSPIQRDTRIPTVIAEKAPEKVVYTNRQIYTGPRVWTSLANETNACFKTKGTRNLYPQGEITPDPTEYDTSVPRKKVSVGDLSSFGVKAERPPLHSPDDNPGPGSYNVKMPKWVDKRGKPTTNRAVHVDQIATAFVPGPGSYDPELITKKRPDDRPNSVFTSKVGRQYSSATVAPGPGKYSPVDPKYLKEGSRDHKLRFTDIKKMAPEIQDSRFPKFGNWIEASKNDNPPPDLYQKIESEHGKGKTIPISPRMALTHKNPNPGPGTYDIVHRSFFRRSFNSSIPKYY